jgi:4-alpha-glucanotransferase
VSGHHFAAARLLYSTEAQQDIRRALQLLGVRKLALAIHDQSFPATSDEELGRGSPYSAGARAFMQFITELGFNAIQLGPQGKTTLANQSPYDGTLFSKNELAINLTALAHDKEWENILDSELLAELIAGFPKPKKWRTRESYIYAWHAQFRALLSAHKQFVLRREQLKPLWSKYQSFVQTSSHWLERDALYDALTVEHETDDWSKWDSTDRELCNCVESEQTAQQKQRIAEIQKEHAGHIAFYRFCQFVSHQQHKTMWEHARKLGLLLFADMQVGFSPRDTWGLRYLFLPGYQLGAPPSRTNPDGQPWGYPVLNPELYYQKTSGAAGPVLSWLNGMIDKILDEFDGLRIDHPHGKICPWIYKSDEPDALHAVQTGARLFDSPDLPEHPRLAQFAIARRDQLADVARYADGWVRELSNEQVDQYALLIDVIDKRLQSVGFDRTNIVCEVLSSCPYPLRRVMEKYGLGRFRVTQKSKVTDPSDIYRSDKASGEDWIMVGTHDTPSLWKVVDDWNEKQKQDWAVYLALRLEPNEESRAAFAEKLATSKGHLLEALFADLFVGPAQNVSVLFADLLGLADTYNSPGVVNEHNWVLSVPPDYADDYARKLSEQGALNMPRSLALALRGRANGNAEMLKLAEKLDDHALVAARAVKKKTVAH